MTEITVTVRLESIPTTEAGKRQALDAVERSAATLAGRRAREVLGLPSRGEDAVARFAKQAATR